MAKMNEMEQSILDMLNDRAQHIVSTISLESPRAVGDAVQSFLENNLADCLPDDFKVESGFERRSMEDIALYDTKGNYYAIDVKTHNINTSFSMPNLISANRLARFYKNDLNYFCILMIGYETHNDLLVYKKCIFQPIECFSWNCLTLGALGWGQIQIKDANHIVIEREENRKNWMLALCDVMQQFYGIEINKIQERTIWFQKEKLFWQQHK